MSNHLLPVMQAPAPGPAPGTPPPASCCCDSGCGSPPTDAAHRPGMSWWWCGVPLVAGWAARYTPWPSLSASLYIAAVAMGGWPLLRGAFRSLAARTLGMDLLMAVAVLGACALGDFAEAATLVLLYRAAEAIEAASLRRSRRALEGLLKLLPERVLLRRDDGALSEVEPGAARIGDLFVVRAGERIALDGRVVAGTSDVNQAPVTGESLPVIKATGDELFAGTLNGGGTLEAVVLRTAGDGAVARIARLVEGAATGQSQRQTTIERFARYYTPTVFVAALLAAVLPPLWGVSWPAASYRALALLVAACPCAFVISGPTAAFCAMTAAARRGVFIRGSAALEELARVRAFAFDKTGTLTVGQPQMTDFVLLNGYDQSQALRIAAALESHSTHPLARAVVEYAAAQGAHPAFATNVTETAGHGLRGSVDGLTYGLERRRGMPAADGTVATLEEHGRSVAILAQGDEPLAALGFADPLRPEAAAALASLRAQGVAATVILSGDNERAVREVARAVGATVARGSLLPEDKLRAIDELAAQYGGVAMVGDGINDAPALARANVGIALGMNGSDLAVEAAQVTLMGNDLRQLPLAHAIAQWARGIISTNITLALLLKLGFIAGLAANLWGSFSLYGGVIADMGATLLVTANALRLLRGNGGA